MGRSSPHMDWVQVTQINFILSPLTYIRQQGLTRSCQSSISVLHHLMTLSSHAFCSRLNKRIQLSKRLKNVKSRTGRSSAKSNVKRSKEERSKSVKLRRKLKEKRNRGTSSHDLILAHNTSNRSMKLLPSRRIKYSKNQSRKKHLLLKLRSKRNHLLICLTRTKIKKIQKMTLMLIIKLVFRLRIQILRKIKTWAMN